MDIQRVDRENCENETGGGGRDRRVPVSVSVVESLKLQRFGPRQITKKMPVTRVKSSVMSMMSVLMLSDVYLVAQQK